MTLKDRDIDSVVMYVAARSLMEVVRGQREVSQSAMSGSGSGIGARAFQSFLRGPIVRHKIQSMMVRWSHVHIACRGTINDSG